jgi:hypothetical protein
MESVLGLIVTGLTSFSYAGLSSQDNSCPRVTKGSPRASISRGAQGHLIAVDGGSHDTGPQDRVRLEPNAQSRLAANGLHASKGALGAFLRRKKSHLSAPKAVTATAHKLARIVYLAIKHGMTYVRQTQAEYQTRVRQQQVKALRKKARELGFAVTEMQTAAVPTPA